MRWREKLVGIYLFAITIYLAIIDYLVLKNVIPQVLNKGLPPDVAQALLLSFSILLTIFILVVYLEQSNLLKKQTKILELDKLPMLIFQKIDSSQDKKQENNLNSIENQENGIQVGERNLAFEIINVSKYPVKIEYVDFIPQEKEYDKETIAEQIRFFKHIFRADTLQGVIIPLGNSLTIPSKVEKAIKVPGVLRIKASNVYFPDLFLEYEYDISSGRIDKIEGLP